MQFPVVLFDLDGTLLDSAAVILGSFHYATETVLRRRFPDEEILARVGGTNLAHQMALLDPDNVDELVHVYREHNDPQYSDLVCFDGVLDVLARLKAEGRRLGIVSAKRRPTSSGSFSCRDGRVLRRRRRLRRHREAQARAPADPQSARAAGSVPAEAAYVGDSPFDVAAARAAGVYAVAVGWGGIHRVEDADAFVETPEDLLGVL